MRSSFHSLRNISVTSPYLENRFLRPALPMSVGMLQTCNEYGADEGSAAVADDRARSGDMAVEWRCSAGGGEGGGVKGIGKWGLGDRGLGSSLGALRMEIENGN